MRTILTLIAFVFCIQTVFSQDLIVTSEGDSINCKITKLKKDNIYFTFKHKNEIRNTLLPLSKVSFHQYSFFEKSEVPKDRIFGKQIYPHWRFAVNGGWSSHTAKISDQIPSDFKQYAKELRSGYHISGDITYYFSEPLGVGFKYLIFNSSNQLNDIFITYPDGTRKDGIMRNDLSISFIGPSFSTRLLNASKKNALTMNMALGYMKYLDKQVVVDHFTMSGNSVGLIYEIGYDIGISKNLALGFQVSFLSATMSQYDWNDGITTKTIKLEPGEFESLHRIDLSIGLRFNK